MFSGAADVDNMPVASVCSDDFADGTIGLLDLLVRTGLAPSKREARQLVQQGGITVDDVKLADPSARLNQSDFEKGYVVVRKGKKVFRKVIVE